VSKIFLYKDGERVGVLQNCSSVQWLEHYQSAGEVKIVAAPTERNKELLTPGTRLYNADSDTSAVIVETEVQAGEDKALIVLADIASAILDERVVLWRRLVTNIETGMYTLLRENLRGLPLSLAEPKGFTESTETELDWGSVLDAVETLATVSGLGFKVCFDPMTAAETFEVYKGTDRSTPGEDYVGSFSTALGNVDAFTLRQGVIDYKNVAIVVGEGAPVTVSLGNVPAEARRELFVNAQNLRREETEASYEQLLRSRGREALAEHLRTFEIECEINQNNMRFGQDYFLGDCLPIRLDEHGIAVAARVASVQHVYETEGNRTLITLDDFRLEEAP